MSAKQHESIWFGPQHVRTNISTRHERPFLMHVAGGGLFLSSGMIKRRGRRLTYTSQRLDEQVQVNVAGHLAAGEQGGRYISGFIY